MINIILQSNMAIVTDTASGIGRSVAILFSPRGLPSYIPDMNFGNAEDAAYEIESICVPHDMCWL